MYISHSQCVFPLLLLSSLLRTGPSPLLYPWFLDCLTSIAQMRNDLDVTVEVRSLAAQWKLAGFVRTTLGSWLTIIQQWQRLVTLRRGQIKNSIKRHGSPQQCLDDAVGNLAFLFSLLTKFGGVLFFSFWYFVTCVSVVLEKSFCFFFVL